uniref:Prostatic acid phosphatase n=1 Tax=Parastrongyloides trichosuri TaxID=131310 RepID=A0A0N4ZMZ1_PARTI
MEVGFKTIIIYLCIIINSIYCNLFDTARKVDVKADIETLQFVHAIWRHGDRTPVVLIPTDTGNDEASWGIGLGELTKKGMLQQYNLGQWIQRRYNGYLHDEYSPFEVYVRSSDYNRTLMSAQANMAGLYKPNNQSQFLPGLQWNPIPVHTMPKEDDKELYDEIYCPTIKSESEAIYHKNDNITKLEEENKDFLTFLGNVTNLSKGPLPLKDVWLVFDPLNAELHHEEEHTLPSWANESVVEKVTTLYDIASKYIYSTDTMIRLKAGPLFRDIMKRLKRKINNQLDSREKLYVYSAHDTSVSAILASLGITPDVFPQYATMVLIELHKVNNDSIVKVFYKNITDVEDVFEYDIEGCPSPCSYDKLIESRGKYIPKKWKEECGIIKWYQWDPATYFALLAMVGFCALFFASLIGIEFLLRWLKRKNESVSQEEYHADNDDSQPLINSGNEDV